MKMVRCVVDCCRGTGAVSRPAYCGASSPLISLSGTSLRTPDCCPRRSRRTLARFLKRQSGRTNHGKRRLRAVLTQAAWAASRTRNTYLSSHYRRLAGRRGKKRAIVAVGHTMLEMMYHILWDDVDYQELGHDYLDKLQPHRLTRYLVKRLESLGHEVTLAPVDRAA